MPGFEIYKNLFLFKFHRLGAPPFNNYIECFILSFLFSLLVSLTAFFWLKKLNRENSDKTKN